MTRKPQHQIPHMHTHLTIPKPGKENRKRRLSKMAEYAFGKRLCGRLHVSLSNRAVIRECRKLIKDRAQRIGRTDRDARHALYLGALAGHAENRALVRKWRL